MNLTYTGGDYCASAGLGPVPQRSVSIFFECYDNPYNPQQDIVLENTACQYTIRIKSRAGCPLQCRSPDNGPICGGHGICGYDATNGKARCYCNQGWTGDELCGYSGTESAPPAKNYAGNIAGGFFGGVCGGVAAALIGFIVKAIVRGLPCRLRPRPPAALRLGAAWLPAGAL